MRHDTPIIYVEDVLLAAVSSPYPENWPKVRDIQLLLADITIELIVLEGRDGDSTGN
jgi:hypothetical protein